MPARTQPVLGTQGTLRGSPHAAAALLRMIRMPALVLTALALCCNAFVGAARAQDRPSEDDMFGATPPPAASDPNAAPAANVAPPAEVPPANADAVRDAPPAAAAETARDRAILGDAADRATEQDTEATDDPLKIGGRILLRWQSAGLEGQRIDRYGFSTPTIVDAYFDARPNDRVRGFVLGRMSYDPTLSSGGSSANLASSVTGSTMGSATLSSIGGAATRGPHVVLDQLWLRFDIDHAVFVTAGKQHVRWGTGRFWTPADFLHLRRRNPLDVFDARTGTTMLKLHLPVESKAWNFYAYGLTEGGDTTPSLAHVAGALRAEFVLGTAELGLGAFVHKGEKPKFAADLSTALGDIDLHAEVALINRSGIDRVRSTPDAALPEQAEAPSWQTPADRARERTGQVIDALYPVTRGDGYRAQVVAGASYTANYNDNDTVSVGGEYFYNPLGYSSPVAYPGLLLPHSRELSNPATFFYLGKQYAALFVSFPAPFSLDLHSFTLSTLANLSDMSFITRFDYGLTLLTHLRLEAFVSARYGESHGEFRLGVEDLDLGGLKFSRAPAIIDFGAGLRLDI